MAQLIVRNLPDEIRDLLKAQARRHGRSMEEEVRSILRDAVLREGPEAGEGLGSRIAALFGDEGISIEERRGS